MPEEQEYVKKLIKVDFTQAELLELGIKLTELIRQGRSLETQKAAAAADFTSRIKQANLQTDSITQKIVDGWELRYEECLVEHDHALNMVRYIFEQDGKRIVVEQRKMTGEEKQMDLGLTPGPPNKSSETTDASQDNVFDNIEAPGFG